MENAPALFAGSGFSPLSSRKSDKERAVPESKFFRHHGGIRSQKPCTPFGPKYFKGCWDRACGELDVRGLDLYGGTRHTSTKEIARLAGSANAQAASEHETNKAFDRYCQYQSDTAFRMASLLKDRISTAVSWKGQKRMILGT